MANQATSHNRPTNFWARAKQAPANSVLNQRKGLFCLARFCRGYLRTNFRGCRLVLRRRDTQFNLRQGTGGVGELTICVGDYFSQRILCKFRPLLGKPPTFRCTLAHCLGTSFDFLRIILDAVENFGCLIHQVEGRHRGANKTQYVFIAANGRPSFEP